MHPRLERDNALRIQFARVSDIWRVVERKKRAHHFWCALFNSRRDQAAGGAGLAVG